MRRSFNVVMVGALPPPHGGQATMLEATILSAPDHVSVYHVGARFSRRADERGSLGPRKLVVLARVIIGIYAGRVLGARSLYYAPSGDELAPAVRDAIVLGSTKWLFKSTIYHFHAGGLSLLLARSNSLVRFVLRRGIGSPSVGLRLSDLSPADAEALGALKVFTVSNGCRSVLSKLPDAYVSNPGVILYVGVLTKTKGLFDLLDAVELISGDPSVVLRLHLAGSFSDDVTRDSALARVKGSDILRKTVVFLGDISGAKKEEAFAEAAVYCYPSFFEHENLPISVLEAMSAGLPVVATRWRAIPSIVKPGVNGLLVSAASPTELATALATILRDSGLRRRLGAGSTQLYEHEYKLEAYTSRIWQILDTQIAEDLKSQGA